jgi:hypothetical protein
MILGATSLPVTLPLAINMAARPRVRAELHLVAGRR